MPYLLWVNDEAKQEVNRAPGYMRQRVRRIIQSLPNEPRPAGSIQMKEITSSNLEVRRLRLDDWRIIYVIDEEWSEIGILAVRKRPPYDYGDLAALLANLG